MNPALRKILFVLLFPIAFPFGVWLRYKMFGKNSAFMNT